VNETQVLANEMMNIARQVGEPDDPFAAWETVDLLLRRSKKCEELEAANTALMTELANLIATKRDQLDALTAERDMWRARALRGAQ